MGSIADGADQRNLWPVDEIPLVGITSKQCDDVKMTENTYVTINFDAS